MGGTLRSLARGLGRRDRMIADLEGFLAAYDAWILPVAAVPAFVHRPLRSDLRLLRETLDVDGQRVPLVMAIGAFTSPFNLTGGPVLALPAGRSADGLPIGVQLVGRRSRDPELLAVGATIARVIGEG